MPARPRLIITLGDPCGIGPELLIKSLDWLKTKADFKVIGARSALDLLAQTRNAQDMSCPGVEWIDPTPDIKASDLKLGEVSAAGGRAAVEAVRRAVPLLMKGEADALVTLPLHKHAAHLAGFHIPGHTELLQELSGASETRMVFLSPTLNVMLHTVHQSLKSVIDGLSAESVAESLRFACQYFPSPHGRPLRIALCALNPHAGEGGAFGHEEAMLVQAIEMARLKTSCEISGPYPSDTLFLRAYRGEFDLVVALYHDQGLIPIKVLEPETAVNCTLGLPFIRTSPDHGTAFDRAGQWSANPANFQSAVDMALKLIPSARAQV